MRMRADGDINGHRAALCKACLARDFRLGTGNIHKEVPMSLDPDDTSPGYRLGRLFAVLEKIQNDALGDVNAGIADRFYAAASATPASIFGMLLNKAKSHLSAVRRKKGEGLAHHLEGHIGEIMDGVDPQLPRSLPLEEQGRFAVGYYHQKEVLKARKGSDQDSDDNAATA
jgi:CRISPR-associated protein Csd1